MAVVVQDLIEQARVREQADGFEAERHFMVSGLAGSPESRYFDALAANGIPAIATAHPGNGSLIAMERRADMEGAGIVRVTVVYRPATFWTSQLQTLASENQPAQIEIGATVHQVQTNVDFQGEPLEVFYNKVTEDADGNFSNPELLRQIGTVDKQLPSVTITLTRKEPRSPGEKALFFVGKINSTQFVRGGDAGMWLCTGIRGSSSDGGFTYDVTYDFQFDKDQWLAEVIYVDPETGNPPEDLLLSDLSFGLFNNSVDQRRGLIAFQVYEAVDFSELNL